MKKYKTDLHVHSLLSDGHITPIEVINNASEQGLERIVFADHNSLHDNFDMLKEYALKKGVDLPFEGIEVNSVYHKEGRPFIKLHMLVYGTSERIRNSSFVNMISSIDKPMNDVIDSDFQKYYQAGIVTKTYEEVFTLDRNVVPTLKKMRFSNDFLHLAIAECQNITLNDAINKYPISLEEEDEESVNFDKFGKPVNVSDLIHVADRCGLVTSIAHCQWLRPYKTEYAPLMNDETLYSMLDDLISIGLEGIEVRHDANDEPHQKVLRKYAESKGLLCTGGSDFHGYGDNRKLLNYGVYDEDFEILKDAVEHKQASS